MVGNVGNLISFHDRREVVLESEQLPTGHQWVGVRKIRHMPRPLSSAGFVTPSDSLQTDVKLSYIAERGEKRRQIHKPRIHRIGERPLQTEEAETIVRPNVIKKKMQKKSVQVKRQ